MRYDTDEENLSFLNEIRQTVHGIASHVYVLEYSQSGTVC